MSKYDHKLSGPAFVQDLESARVEPRSFAIRAITDRQLQCLAWVQEGKSATDIGIILGLSGRTVEKHLIKLCGHLGVKTRVQAVVRARELGLIGANAP